MKGLKKKRGGGGGGGFKSSSSKPERDERREVNTTGFFCTNALTGLLPLLYHVFTEVSLQTMEGYGN